jgi:hypothetical protein
MLTKLELFFWYSDVNFQLWSQSLQISKTFSGFSKNGQKKCPKLNFGKHFWKKKLVNIINS